MPLQDEFDQEDNSLCHYTIRVFWLVFAICLTNICRPPNSKL